MEMMKAKPEVCKCGADLKGSETFCTRCGQQVFKKMRSENEVKAELQKINLMIAGTNDVMLSLAAFQVQTCLEWVLGKHMSASEILRMIDDKQKEREMLKKPNG